MVKNTKTKTKNNPWIIALIVVLAVGSTLFFYNNQGSLNLSWSNILTRFTIIAPFADYQIIDTFDDNSINPELWQNLGFTTECFTGTANLIEANGELTLIPSDFLSNCGHSWHRYSTGVQLKKDLANKEAVIYGYVDNLNYAESYSNPAIFELSVGPCVQTLSNMKGEFIYIWKPSLNTPGEYSLYNGAGVELCHTSKYHDAVTAKLIDTGGITGTRSFIKLYEVREKTPLACQHSTTDALTVQAFTGPKVFSLEDLRFPAGSGLASLCLDNPILRVTPTMSGPDRESTVALSNGQSLQVPEGETWLVFYYFDNSANVVPTLCNIGQLYNLENTAECVDYSTVVFACGTGGVWDEVSLTCTNSVPVIPTCEEAADPAACCEQELTCEGTASWDSNLKICTCNDVPVPDDSLPPTCSNNGLVFNYSFAQNEQVLWEWKCRSTRTAACNPWEELLDGYCSWDVDASPYCTQGSLVIHTNGTFECVYTPPVSGGGGGGGSKDLYVQPVCIPPMTWNADLKRCEGETKIVLAPVQEVPKVSFFNQAKELSFLEWAGILIILGLIGYLLKEQYHKRGKK